MLLLVCGQFGPLVFVYVIPYSKRAANSQKILKKFEVPIKYDFDSIIGEPDHTLKASEVGKKGFSLQAALMHTGASMSSGHYTAYTRASEGKNWSEQCCSCSLTNMMLIVLCRMWLDDSKVSVVNTAEMKSTLQGGPRSNNSCVLLVYARTSTVTSSPKPSSLASSPASSLRQGNPTVPVSRSVVALVSAESSASSLSSSSHNIASQPPLRVGVLSATPKRKPREMEDQQEDSVLEEIKSNKSAKNTSIPSPPDRPALWSASVQEVDSNAALSESLHSESVSSSASVPPPTRTRPTASTRQRLVQARVPPPLPQSTNSLVAPPGWADPAEALKLFESGDYEPEALTREIKRLSDERVRLEEALEIANQQEVQSNTKQLELTKLMILYLIELREKATNLK